MRSLSINRTAIFTSLMIALSTCAQAQSIIIRPLYGTKFTRTNPQNVIDNFDASFQGDYLLQAYDKGINIEYMRKHYSIEIGYGDREYGFSFRTQSPEKNFQQINLTNGTTREIHLMYNYLLPSLFPKWQQKFSIAPILSLGGNIGFNNSQKRYSGDSSFLIGRSVYQLNPIRYIDFEMRDTAANKILYSLQFKAGFNLKHKNIERFRLQFYYTLGLNNIASRTYRYYHTNDFYSGKIFTRGNEYGIVASIPLYIKRKR